MAGWRRHLVSQLARIADAEYANRASGDPAFPDGHVRERSIVKLQTFDAALERLARFRAGDGHLGPLVRDAAELDVEIGPRHLRVIFQVLEHLGCLGGRRRHQVVMLAEA